MEEQKQCDKKYNINELLAQIQYGFPSQLSNCGSSFAKDLALSKVPFSKTPAPEPKSYMTKCTMDSIKSRLPEGFPGVDKVLDDTQKFLQTVLNTALSGGVPNPTSLASAASDIKGLLDGIKNLSAENPCIVDEPYEYVEPVKVSEEGGDNLESKKKDKFFTLGIRAGLNSSHLYATYDNGYHRTDGTYESRLGIQAGLVFDFTLSEMFHIQPGIMLVLNGAKDNRSSYGSPVFKEGVMDLYNIDFPVLISLKYSAFRINVGPYFGLSGGAAESGGDGNGQHSSHGHFDFGISSGLGFDISWFYIGIFYDYGLIPSYSESFSSWSGINRDIEAYNRTLGLNLGVNL